MKAALGNLYAALRNKAGVIPAEENLGKGRLQILARLNADKMPNWQVVMQRLKKAEFQAEWSIDISKTFFLKNHSPNNPLVHGWRIIIKSADMETALEHLTKAITASPNARVELEEVPLPGGGRHRQFNSSAGKGASLTSGSRGSGPALHLLKK